jgi:hypothetical protein
MCRRDDKHKYFAENCGERRLLGMSGQQSEDNIEIEPTLILRDSVDTIYPDQGSLRWLILVSALRNVGMSEV